MDRCILSPTPTEYCTDRPLAGSKTCRPLECGGIAKKPLANFFSLSRAHSIGAPTGLCGVECTHLKLGINLPLKFSGQLLLRRRKEGIPSKILLLSSGQPNISNFRVLARFQFGFNASQVLIGFKSTGHLNKHKELNMCRKRHLLIYVNKKVCTYQAHLPTTLHLSFHS